MPDFRSLSKRLLVWQIILSVTTLTALCSVVYIFLAVSLENKQENVLQQNMAVVQHLVMEANKHKSTDELVHKLDDLLFSNDELSVSLRAAQGTQLYEKERVYQQNAVLKRGQSFITTESWGSVEVNLQLDIKADRELKEKFAWLLIAVAVIGSTLVASLGYWISRAGLKPLRLLTQQTQRISASDLDARLDSSVQPLEIQGLVAQFNALLTRLQQSYVQMEDFNANVAHELKNPIATLIASHELALRSGTRDDAQTEYLASNLEELQRISAIVNDMLFMSRADSGSLARTVWVENLAVLAQSVVDYYEASAAEADVTLLVQGDGGAHVDTGLFKRALSNLVSNAIRHADKHSTILIKVDKHAELPTWMRVRVTNVGSDVSEADLPKIFERFFRATTTMDSPRDHHGLGLAIVSAVAKMHAGKTFVSHQNGVFEIGFEFPIG
ncbi:heavy metal sensor histidine kinase [Variovorax sp. PCZ-1]|uniref:heavy metal sensor histidine kinase n=1 Tax=Variovorax sp. PCZ-1 TaxID=2835533 RepID=UPI001BCF8E5D|nr:heavy metal sensor histidine kinase [Variovorax sp. PCZ-1]MBS7808594.1 heavy metal sensor histidine kinase [Variovorax sp. PCZ-1]